MAKDPDDFEDYLRSDDGKAATPSEIGVLKQMRRGTSEPWSIEKYTQMRATVKLIPKRPKLEN